jgi:hypothetical protein
MLRAVCIVLGLLAVLKLGSEFHRLTVSTAPNGAIDLALRHEETHRWFAGEPVYTELQRITYPPAAYLVFWPFMGWLDLPAARWLWALASAAMLAWLTWLLVRASGATSGIARLTIVLVVLSMNAVGVAIGNGQVVLFVLPVVIAALTLIRDPRGGWTRDLAAASLAVVALLKPTLSLPFVWLVAVSGSRTRLIAFTVGLYLVSTLIAVQFQRDSPASLIHAWLLQSARHLEGGYGDVQSVSLSLGWGSWGNVATAAIFLWLGVWTWTRRHVDFWILLGVAAIVARLWTYHRNYDDALILLPLIALFRLARQNSAGDDVDLMAGALFAIGVMAMLMPARLEFGGPPMSLLYTWGHVIVWLAMLACLLWAARPTRRAANRAVASTAR